MPRPRQLNVLSDLQELSKECDQIAQDCFTGGILKDWFDECQRVIVEIRDCSSVEDLKKIQNPPTITSFLGVETKKRSSETKDEVGVQVEKIHDKKKVTVPTEADDKSSKNKEDKKLSAVVNHIPSINATVPHEVVTDKLLKNVENNFSAVVNHTPCNEVNVPHEVFTDKLLESKEDNKLSAVVNHTPCNKVTVPHEVVTDKLLKNAVDSKLSVVVNHTPCNKVTVLKGAHTVLKKQKRMPPLVLSKNENSDSFKKCDEAVNTPVLLTTTKNNSVLLQQIKTPVNFNATFVQNDSEDKNKSMKPQTTFDETFVRNDSEDKNKSTKPQSAFDGTFVQNDSDDKNKSAKPQSTLDETFVKNDSESDKTKSQLTETPVLNKTFHKVADETVIVDSGQKSKLLKEISQSCMLTRSGSKKLMMATSGNDAGNGKLTRSGSKRKSSTSGSYLQKASNKKQKLTQETPATVVTKTSKAKHPLLKKNNPKSGLLTPKSKSKVSAVIVPTVQSKTSIVSKEQQILEEIKKKEEKAKTNIKRVLAERQQKSELNKKTLEQKTKKALEKRMQMEKEKEERLKQESQGIKLKDHTEIAAKKTKTRELTENNGKENKSMISNSVKPNDTYCVDAAVKTPISKKSNDSDCYELTPVSANYDFSDDEEERQVGKPVPKWAQGVALKSALMQQYYNPIDPLVVFGSHIDNPDLAEIFKIDKKSYKKRTSSAVWNSSYRC